MSRKVLEVTLCKSATDENDPPFSFSSEKQRKTILAYFTVLILLWAIKLSLNLAPTLATILKMDSEQFLAQNDYRYKFCVTENQIVKGDRGPKDKWIVRYLLIYSATHLSVRACC